MEFRDFERRDDLLDYLDSDPEVRRQLAFEAAVAARHRDQEEFVLDGWCRVCDAAVGFAVDRRFGGRETAAGWVPNWRERLACPGCGLNNRQRAMVGEIVAAAGRRGRPLALYAMEQISPSFRWLQDHLDGVACTGSEYLGPGILGGTIRDGVLPGLRHEDVEALSFDDASFDLVISNDVFEHVDSPAAGLREVARVLRPGGEMLFSVPFGYREARSVRRAEGSGEGLRHLLPPEYHGDPMSPDGSLVYHEYGWDLLDLCREAGFSAVTLRLYWSYFFGHMGCPLFYFRARRSRRPVP